MNCFDCMKTENFFNRILKIYPFSDIEIRKKLEDEELKDEFKICCNMAKLHLDVVCKKFNSRMIEKNYDYYLAGGTLAYHDLLEKKELISESEYGNPVEFWKGLVETCLSN